MLVLLALFSTKITEMKKLTFIVAIIFAVNAQAQQQGTVTGTFTINQPAATKVPVSKWAPKKKTVSKWAPKKTAYYSAATTYKAPATSSKNIVYSYIDTVTKDAENFFPLKGNVGIGTNQPMAALEIKRNAGDGDKKNFLLSLSNIWSPNGLNEPTIMFNNGDNTSNFSYWTLGSRISGDNAHKDPVAFKIGYKAPNEPNEKEFFSIDSYQGRVKIGSCNTNVDGYKLYVEEGILTEKVKVAVKDSEDWFDNVFEPDYKIMPINDLASYVKQNKHLPEIPTTSDVLKSGIDLGKMNGLLLKKVEELTLYMIDLKKQLDDTKKEIELLKNK